MRKAKLFKNGQSQAVRLPREFRFEGNEVYVTRLGSGILILPVKDFWDGWMSSLDSFSEDFMKSGREQPENIEERESF